jgi:death-on-curing protein
MMEGAAPYLFSLCSNRPFVGGNKRVALATCLVFLRQNGIYDPVNLDVGLWKSLTLCIAGGRIDRTTTTPRLQELEETSVAA